MNAGKILHTFQSNRKWSEDYWQENLDFYFILFNTFILTLEWPKINKTNTPKLENTK